MKQITIILSIAFSFSAFSQVRQFQTTRLISTAGAGVASISLSDSAVLNPASLGFFQNSEVSYIHNKTTFDTNGQETDFTNFGGIIADTQSQFKGTIKYIDTENQFAKEKTYGITFAKLKSKNTSFGVGYDYKKVQNKITGEKDDRHILNIGGTSVISKNLTFGSVLRDPFNANSFEHRLILGLQTQVASSIYFMLDALTNQRFKDFSDTFGWKAALQLKILKNTFLRAGYSEDKRFNTKETGYGIEIRLVKFHISLAYRQTKIDDESLPSVLLNDTESKELVGSLAVRF